MQFTSLIKPELYWTAASTDYFACFDKWGKHDDMVEVIANDRVTVLVLEKYRTEPYLAFFENLHFSCAVFASIRNGPVFTGETKTFLLCDLFKTAAGQSVAVFGPDTSLSYGQRRPEHKRMAELLVQKYMDERENKRRVDELLEQIVQKLVEQIKRLDQELAAEMPDEDLVRQLGVTISSLRDHLSHKSDLPDPQPPQLSDLGLQLEEVGFVLLSRSKSLQREEIMNEISFSGRGESRNGRYSCTPIETAAGTPAAIVRWSPRTSLPPALELKAAVEQRLPSALEKPRSPNIVPPTWVSDRFAAEFEFNLGAVPDVEADPINGELPNLLEVAVGVMGGFSEVRAASERVFREHCFDAIAWYQPFHNFANPVWGIYLDAQKLDQLAIGIAEDLRRTSEPRPYHLAAQLALRLTAAHEMFHAKVEFAATFLELTGHRKRYIPYHNGVYLPARGTSDWLEEALANWSSRDWLQCNMQHLQSIGLLQDPQLVTRVIEAWLDFSPAGYRDWRVGFDDSSWRRLATELATARPNTEQKLISSLPLEGLLRGQSLFDLRQDDVPIFFYGRGVVADIYYSAPRRREVIKVLSRFGYYPLPGRGKGSHEVWQGPGGKFTIPTRDPLSVGVFHELLGHFGWTKQQYLSEIR